MAKGINEQNLLIGVLLVVALVIGVFLYRRGEEGYSSSELSDKHDPQWWGEFKQGIGFNASCRTRCRPLLDPMGRDYRNFDKCLHNCQSIHTCWDDGFKYNKVGQTIGVDEGIVRKCMNNMYK